jgi:surfactin synthase thioesterase subunit
MKTILKYLDIPPWNDIKCDHWKPWYYIKKMAPQNITNSENSSYWNDEKTGIPTALSKTDTRWFVRPLAKPQADTRLFCFPHAGGAASAYHRWGKLLPAEVLSVQLPFREGRMNESPIRNMNKMVQSVVEAMQHDHMVYPLHKPFAFFGHSMGSMLAYETACELRRCGLPLPAHIFVSGRTPPNHVPDEAQLHLLPDHSFIDELERRFGGLPDVVRNEPELMNIFLPVLRSDLEMLETHICRRSAPLDIPITAFTGEDDTRATRALLEGWSNFTLRWNGARSFPGGHFYLQDTNNPMFAALITEIEALAQSDVE